MPEITVIEQRLATLDAERKDLLDAKLAAIGRSTIRCLSCKKISQLRRWIFIQDHFYVRPYSCSDGDYWSPNGTNTCHIICPKCGFENYIFTHPQRNKIVRLVDDSGFKFQKAKLFIEIQERHERK